MDIKHCKEEGITWESWRSNPYVRFITISTHELQTTLGRIRWNGDKNVWLPSPWGDAVMDVIEDIHNIQDTVIVEASAVMPNHVHLLTHFRIQSPQVAQSFINFCKQRFAQEMIRRRPTHQTIWEKAVFMNNVQTRLTQRAYCEELHEHHQHWKSDSLYRPYKDPFQPEIPDVNHGFRDVLGTEVKSKYTLDSEGDELLEE